MYMFYNIICCILCIFIFSMAGWFIDQSAIYYYMSYINNITIYFFIKQGLTLHLNGIAHSSFGKVRVCVLREKSHMSLN